MTGLSKEIDNFYNKIKKINFDELKSQSRILLKLSEVFPLQSKEDSLKLEEELGELEKKYLKLYVNSIGV